MATNHLMTRVLTSPETSSVSISHIKSNMLLTFQDISGLHHIFSVMAPCRLVEGSCISDEWTSSSGPEGKTSKHQACWKIPVSTFFYTLRLASFILFLNKAIAVIKYLWFWSSLDFCRYRVQFSSRKTAGAVTSVLWQENYLRFFANCVL
jgi:hypothetical protein